MCKYRMVGVLSSKRGTLFETMSGLQGSYKGCYEVQGAGLRRLGMQLAHCRGRNRSVLRGPRELQNCLSAPSLPPLAYILARSRFIGAPTRLGNI